MSIIELGFIILPKIHLTPKEINTSDEQLIREHIKMQLFGPSIKNACAFTVLDKLGNLHYCVESSNNYLVQYIIKVNILTIPNIKIGVEGSEFYAGDQYYYNSLINEFNKFK